MGPTSVSHRWEGSRLSVVVVVVMALLGTSLALSGAAPVAAQTTPECEIATTNADDDHPGDVDDIDMPPGARYQIRTVDTGVATQILQADIKDANGVLVRSWDFLHQVFSGDPPTQEHRSGWYTLQATAVPPLTLTVTGDGGAAINAKITVRATLVYEDPSGQCPVPSGDVVGGQNGDVDSNGEAGDPVTTGTGSFRYRPELGAGPTDLLLPTYNSMDQWATASVNNKIGVFGPQRASLLDTRSIRGGTSATAPLHLRLPTGRTFRAAQSVANTWTPPSVLEMQSIVRNATTGTYTWTFLSGAVWSFDNQGRLTATDDGQGRRIEITRATSGMPTRVVTRLAGVVGHAWTIVDTGVVGLVDQIVGPYDADLTTAPTGTAVIAMTYRLDDRLDTITYPYPSGGTSSGGESYGYGWSWLLESVTRDVSATDADTVVSNAYDRFGRVIWQEHLAGEVDLFDYARSGTQWLTTVEHHDGPTVETVVYTHDSQARLVEVEDPYEETATRAWSGDDPTSLGRRGGGEETRSYDASGRPSGFALADPDDAGDQSGAVSVTYCSATDQRPVDITDAAGVVKRYWWTSGTDPYACDAGRTVPVRITDAHGTALAADTTYTSADGLPTSVTDADGVRVDLVWEAGRALLLSRTDFPDGPANPGRTTFYGYDAAGRQIATRDPGGVETWTVRDAAGRVVQQVGPVAVTRTCGPTSCAFGTTPPSGPTRSWSYDLTGELQSATDEAGKVTTYTVTEPFAGGRVETVTEPPHGDDAGDPLSQVATVTTSTYDRFDRLATVEVGDPSDPASVATTTYTYDPLGRVAQQSREVGGGEPDLVESYAYDADGNQTRVVHGAEPDDTDRAAVVRRYDLRGRLVEEWGATGDTSAPSSVSGSSATAVRQHTEWVYDDADRLLAEIVGDGPEQRTTFHRYDAAGRLRYVIVDRDGDQVVSSSPTGGPTDSADGVTEHTYTPAGRSAQVIGSPVNTPTFVWATGTQANKRPTTYGYDGAGQVISVTDPSSKVTTQEWDARGQLERVTVPGGYWTEYGYDDAGRITRVTNPSPTGTGTVDVLTGHDARGLVTSETDAHPSGTTGAPTRAFTYHDDGSLATATNALGGPTGTVGYVYDARGNRTARTSWTQDSGASSAYQVVDTWAYDLADRPTSEELAGAVGPTTTTYDAVTGRPTVVTSPSGRTETTDYWNSGLVRSVTTMKPSDAHGPADTSRTCSWYDTVGQRRHTLDDDLVGTACTAGAVTTETWTAAGTRASVTTPDSSLTPGGVDETLSYVWDLNGLLRTITHPDGTVLRWTWGRSGQLTRIERPATSTDVAVYDYDTALRLQSETTNGGAVTRTWTLHANGAPAPRRVVETATGEGGRTTDITYRPDGRVGAEVTGGRTQTWSYDAAGQVTGRTDSGGPDHSYAYGPRGLRLSETVDGVTRTSTYDAGARLVDSTGPAGTTTYGYDDDGRRVDVTLPGASTPLHTTYDSRGLPVEIDLTATDVQQRTYDADRRLVEIAETGAPTQAQVWNPATPTWQPVIVRDPTGWQRVEHGLHGPVSVQDDGGGVTAFRQDRQHSTTTSVPVPTAPAVYEPFGQGGGAGVVAGYRGERLLAGLIHLRHRDLDPTTGTFTTRDPLDGVVATPTETNPYHYADNDPANKVDPLGLSPSDDDFDIEDPDAGWALNPGPALTTAAAAAATSGAVGACIASVVCLVGVGALIGVGIGLGVCTSTELCQFGGSDPGSLVTHEAEQANEGRPGQQVPNAPPAPVPVPDPGGGGSGLGVGGSAPAGDCLEGAGDGVEDVRPDPVNLHHSDPVFMGGAVNQPLTSMPRSEHVALHCDMNEFLETRTDGAGNTMRPKSNNSGQQIRQNFTRQQRLQALADFYKGRGAGYTDAARDFFAQHPGLR